MLVEKHSWCELDQLNYHKQLGNGGGAVPQVRAIITTTMELSSVDRQPYVKPGRDSQTHGRS